MPSESCAVSVLAAFCQVPPQKCTRRDDDVTHHDRPRHGGAGACRNVGGRPFVAMEYVAGVEWAALQCGARRIGAMLSIAASARIALDVALALEAVHNARDAGGELLGLVHGDVSPRNVVIDDEGRAKLMDFGSASSTRTRTRAASAASPSSTPLTGTLPYVAPERLLGCAASARSDQFSLGIVLWQALTGCRAFRSTQPRELVRARVPRARTHAPRRGAARAGPHRRSHDLA